MYSYIHLTFHVSLLELHYKQDNYNTLESIEIDNEEK
jgi:hypothetical protein